ncbi:MAG TPA: urease accessory protein, partial [Devosia sp.]|nr:urease accessory protein [Devosia sp.]
MNMLDIAQSEPALQRSFGNGEIRYGKDGLRGLFQQGCTKILLPETYGDPPQAVLVNTAGGLTGGDRLGLDCSLGAGASLCVTSQTAERVYRSCGGEAQVTNRLRLGEDSSLEWLPQETILFDQSRLRRLLEVHMEENSRLLALESFVLGRRAMGETLANAQLSDQWRIWRGGKPVYADG